MNLSPDQENNEFKIIAVISVFLSIIFLDQTGVGVILASIQKELMLQSITIAWIMNAYIITLTLFLLFFSRISDRYGEKNIFATGISVFLLASVGCATANSGTALVLFRALQGVGASMGYATYLLILNNNVPISRRGKALGTSAAFAAVALALGPLLGGFFSSVISWRYLFWLNVPICLICLYFIFSACKNTMITQKHKIDFVGLLFYMPAIFCSIFILMEGDRIGWSNIIILSMIPLTILLFTILFLYESKKSYSLFDVSLFKNKVFIASVIILFGNYACVTSMVFWALWMQYVLKFSAFKTGIALLPAGLPYILSSRMGGKLYDKSGPKAPLLIGSIFFFIGFVEMALVSQMNNYFLFMLGMILFGVGWGYVRPCAILSAINNVPNEQKSMASGLISTFRQYGASFGFSLVNAVIATSITLSLKHIIKTNNLLITPSQLNDNFIHNTAISSTLSQAISVAHDHGFMLGLLFISTFALLNIILVFKYIPQSSGAKQTEK